MPRRRYSAAQARVFSVTARSAHGGGAPTDVVMQWLMAAFRTWPGGHAQIVTTLLATAASAPVTPTPSTEAQQAVKGPDERCQRYEPKRQSEAPIKDGWGGA